MRVCRGLLFALSVFSLAYSALRRAEAQIGVRDVPPVPVTITLCESPNSSDVKNCGTLTSNGQNYHVAQFGEYIPKELSQSIADNHVALKGPVTTPIAWNR